MNRVFHAFWAVVLFTTVIGIAPANASVVVTKITATVVSIGGLQVPFNLSVNDSVDFQYQYDDAGTQASNYYLDGTVVTNTLASYPHLQSLSDADASFSSNLIATFSEFSGSNGYSYLNANWVWTQNGVRNFHSKLSPSVIINMGYELARGLTPHSEGVIQLWSGGQQSVTTIVLDWTDLKTTNVQIVPEPESLALFGIAFAGLFLTHRKAKQA